MPFKDPNNFGLIEALILGLFAATGGLLGYLMRTIDQDEKPNFYKGMVEFFASGFVGVIGMLLCKAFEFDVIWAGVICGVFGWMGAKSSIVLITNALRRKLGVSRDEPRADGQSTDK